MKAFKFRAESQVAFALDIILNRQLFCADWRTLNDPVEGVFSYSYGPGDDKDAVEEAVDAITAGKSGLKVCSLSKTFDSHLLWAHYASGFSGMAIEVELPDDDRVREVVYRGVFAHLSTPVLGDADAMAKDVLSSKYDAWAYEQEVRVLQRDPVFKLSGPVTRLIVGHRMNPALVKGLSLICKAEGIEMFRTGIGDEGIDADWLDL
ncbi:MAG: hypothetical protein H6742_14890 [Alphaproteobacteria bacterium]|nr:hypothetical protein [Alphaproteobacteria bacterium]